MKKYLLILLSLLILGCSFKNDKEEITLKEYKALLEVRNILNNFDKYHDIENNTVPAMSSDTPLVEYIVEPKFLYYLAYEKSVFNEVRNKLLALESKKLITYKEFNKFNLYLENTLDKAEVYISKKRKVWDSQREKAKELEYKKAKEEFFNNKKDTE